jgi:hypothetical protein
MLKMLKAAAPTTTAGPSLPAGSPRLLMVSMIDSWWRARRVERI